MLIFAIKTGLKSPETVTGYSADQQVKSPSELNREQLRARLMLS
jgi:hypothetical protein